MRSAGIRICMTVLILGMGGLLAQIPPDWQLDIHSYEHVATLTARVQWESGEEMPEGTLAAFQGQEVRGLAGRTVSGGSGLYYLLIYANSSGEEIRFKFYSEALDSVFELRETVIFQSGSSYGGVDDPFLLSAEDIAVSLRHADASHFFVLHRNLPNPFNPWTRIRFTLSEAADTELIIYDLLGRAVYRQTFGVLNAGLHEKVLNAAALTGKTAGSAVYYYQIRSGAWSGTGKMLYIK